MNKQQGKKINLHDTNAGELNLLLSCQKKKKTLWTDSDILS